MNMDVQNKFGETALHVCSGQSGNLELAKLLILKGANYTLKNQLGDSPLGIYNLMNNMF
jgi:ankyrin repeat protein